MNDVNDNIKINNPYIDDPTLMKYIDFLVSTPSGILKEIQHLQLHAKISEIDKQFWASSSENNDEEDSFNEQISNNDTLLISERLNKIVLPYTIEEVMDIFEKNRELYNNKNEIIEKVFTRSFSDYKIPFSSRYKEAMKLARDREKFSLADSICLSLEMMRKRFLHPAIISACRTLDELDVYLDCLDKNELDDFKIFKIKYELYPTVTVGKYAVIVPESKLKRIWNYIKNLFKKKENVNLSDDKE